LAALDKHLELDARVKTIDEELMNLKCHIEARAEDGAEIIKYIEHIIGKTIDEDLKIAVLEFSIGLMAGKKAVTITRQIFDFVKQGAMGESPDNAFIRVILNKNIEAYINKELFEYVENIESPYNCVEIARLAIEESEEFIDPITGCIMNAPVILHSKNYNFDTLDLIQVQDNGFRLNPFDRRSFTLDEVVPDYELQKRIKNKILEAATLRNKIVADFCKAARDGNLESLVMLRQKNPTIDVDEVYKDGFTALHYACNNAQLECVKYLICCGADLELPAGKAAVTAFNRLQKIDHNKAELLKQYLLETLQKAIDEKDPTAHLKYAKLLLAGIVVEKNIEQAVYHLEQGAALGNEDCHIQIADMYANGLYGMQKDIAKAILLYEELIYQKNSIIAEIKLYQLFAKEQQDIIFDEKSLKNIASMANNFQPDGLYLYSLMYLHGVGVDMSAEFALKYLKYAADCGSMLGQNDYFVHLVEQPRTKQTLVSALKYLKMPADKGLVIAQYNYAKFRTLLAEGPEHLVEAIKYYKLAADEGFEEAQIEYASCCLSGLGTEINAAEAVKYYRSAAAKGNPDAQFGYAECLLDGLGVEANPIEGARLLKLSADAGCAKAQHRYGTLYIYGEVIDKDLTLAAYYFKLSAIQGNRDGQNCYALCCQKGDGVVKNIEEAIRYHIMAAEQGHPYACTMCGLRYMHGDGVVKDLHMAAKYLLRAAAHGCRDSQYFYALCLLDIDSVEQNLELVAHYFKMAADQGHVGAQYEYAALCINGEMSKNNYKHGVKYFKMAADHGNVLAQYNYAVLCKAGAGIEVNFVEAAKYAKLAADSGSSLAQTFFSRCLYNGDGIAENTVLAVHYAKLAVIQKDPVGQYLYALFLREGKCLEEDPHMAAENFKLSADQGYAPAQNNYAACLIDGYGLEMNIDLALHYFNLAADQGHPNAKLALEHLSAGELLNEAVTKLRM
jgi:TPR repeat protein